MSVEDVADVEEAGVVDVEDVADVEETGGADVGEASPSQLCLSSPMVLNIVVLWLPSPRFSPSHLNTNGHECHDEMMNQRNNGI